MMKRRSFSATGWIAIGLSAVATQAAAQQASTLRSDFERPYPDQPMRVTSCRFVDIPQLRLEPRSRIPWAVGAGVAELVLVSSESPDVRAEVRLLEDGLAGRLTRVGSVQFILPSTHPTGPGEPSFPARLSIDGRDSGIELGAFDYGNRIEIKPMRDGDTGLQGDTGILVRRLGAGGIAVLTATRQDGTPRGRWTFQFPAGSLTVLQAVGWECR
jgi:hypothetical protein